VTAAQVRAEVRRRWKHLAERSARRVDALLVAITMAERMTQLDRQAIVWVLVAELETAIYHSERARGADHQTALTASREGRKLVRQMV
jgi:hypothetical protein